MKPVKVATLNEADVFNALIVDPIANSIKYAVELGYSLQEVKHGIDTALFHAEAEITGRGL